MRSRVTDLEVVLSATNARLMLVCGLITSGAVLSGVRQAADLDYAISVVADCCADPDPELHSVVVQRLLGMQAEVVVQESAISTPSAGECSS